MAQKLLYPIEWLRKTSSYFPLATPYQHSEEEMSETDTASTKATCTEATREKYQKTETTWPIHCVLEEKTIMVGRWASTQWQLNGFELYLEEADLNEKREALECLELHKDERTDYRFNLSSQNPKLFLVLDSLALADELNVVTLTASQSVAGQYMDGDYLVLSYEMPLPVQAWIEAFIGRHGELLEHRRKKRKGAGRSSGN